MLKCVPRGLFAVQSLRAVVLLWQTLVKIFSGSLSSIGKCHAVIAYHDTPIHLDSKCQIPSCCPPSPCTCRPADLPTKKWMHPIADAVAITNRNYGQSSPTNRFSPSEDREHFISSVRNSNLGLCFFPSKCCVSHLSVDRFGKNFGGVMTLGQVKSSQNFCSFGPQRAEKLNI